MWWNILKNTKLSGKAKGKGTSFDASKIKINIDKNDCKKKLLQYIKNAGSLNSRASKNIFVFNPVGIIKGTKAFKNLPEEDACEIIKLIDSSWILTNTFILDLLGYKYEKLTNNEDILDAKVGKYTFRRWIRAGGTITNKSQKQLYIEYSFGLTSNLPATGIYPSWAIMAIIREADWPSSEWDWRK